MHAIALCIAMLTFAQDVRTEYTFKNVSAALFLKQQWRGLETLIPGIQLAKSLQNPPPTGPWVYLDEKKNKLVFGSRDDAAEAMPMYMAQFDVRQRQVKLSVLVSRPDWKLETSGNLLIANNETVTFGAESFGALFQIRPRGNNDGSLSVLVTMVTVPDKERSTCVARISYKGTMLQVLDGRAFLVKEGKLEFFEKISTPPTGERWKPFRLEIRALP